MAADLVPLPGLKQPFNFMGRLAAEGRRELEALLDRAAEEDDKVKVEDWIEIIYLIIFVIRGARLSRTPSLAGTLDTSLRPGGGVVGRGYGLLTLVGRHRDSNPGPPAQEPGV